MCVCFSSFLFLSETTTKKNNFSQFTSVSQVEKSNEQNRETENLTWKFNAVFSSLHFLLLEKLTKENPIDRWSRKIKWKVHHHQHQHLRNVSEQGFIYWIQ